MLQQIETLRIEIDAAKRDEQVTQITESEFFTDLQSQAAAMRLRKRDPGDESPPSE